MCGNNANTWINVQNEHKAPSGKLNEQKNNNSNLDLIIIDLIESAIYCRKEMINRIIQIQRILYRPWVQLKAPRVYVCFYVKHT